MNKNLQGGAVGSQEQKAEAEILGSTNTEGQERINIQQDLEEEVLEAKLRREFLEGRQVK